MALRSRRSPDGLSGLKSPVLAVFEESSLLSIMKSRRHVSPQFRWAGLLFVLSSLAVAANAAAQLEGHLTDPQGLVVPDATIRLWRAADSTRRDTHTNAQGNFVFRGIEEGEYRITAESPGLAALSRIIAVPTDGQQDENLQFTGLASQMESVSVTASVSDVGVFEPDPAQRVLIRDETLDANPGRPGFPISIPGMPVESPAGGVKPPQYFAPGVAGDHGEPIAMFFQVGGYLFPNNLPANAHGNGYADPNVIIPIAIESVQTDGAAFNVREGNNSVNSAITFGLRDRIEPVIRLTGDYRDLNLVTAWSPANITNRAWVGAEVSYGNGYLDRLEHRKQYKGNVSKVFTFGRHELSAYGIGYYGTAFQPGLIPIDRPVPDDTIDVRQHEETSNGAVIVNDAWRLTDHRQFQFSGFYRYYTLDVRPNFGDGLIRQSEHRNVNSEDVLYTDRWNSFVSLLAGVDLRREAPRALNLDKADAQGVFQPDTSNNLTINFYSPFAALDGKLLPFLHYNVGYRADRVTVTIRTCGGPTSPSTEAQRSILQKRQSLSCRHGRCRSCRMSPLVTGKRSISKIPASERLPFRAGPSSPKPVPISWWPARPWPRPNFGSRWRTSPRPSN